MCQILYYEPTFTTFIISFNLPMSYNYLSYLLRRKYVWLIFQGDISGGETDFKLSLYEPKAGSFYYTILTPVLIVFVLLKFHSSFLWFQ